MTDEERNELLGRALQGDPSAAGTLIAALEGIPARFHDRIRLRLLDWVSTPRNLSPDHFNNLVLSYAMDCEFEEMRSPGYSGGIPLQLKEQLEGIVRACVPPLYAEDAISEAMLIALEKFDPSQGTLLAFLRGVIRNIAPKYWDKLPLPPPPEKEEDDDEAIVEGPPPSEAFDAVLAAVLEAAPHKAMVFVLRRLTDWDLGEIERRCSPLRLCDLIGIVEEAYLRIVNTTGVRRCFRNLRERLDSPEGERKLSDFFSRDPRANLAAWANEVATHTIQTLVRMEAEFLSLVFSLSAIPPHKLLCYAYLMLLRWPVRELWAQSRGTLYRLKNEFPTHYPSTAITQDRIMSCMQPLGRELDRPPTKPAGQTTLASYAGDERHQALSRWRGEVQRVVRSKAGEKGLMAIAYVTGAIETNRHRSKSRKAAG